MEKWKKNFGFALLSMALMTVAPTGVEASACDRCDNDCCGFDLGVDFLWWKPCVDELNYAARRTLEESGSFKKGKHRVVDTDWDSGFRIRLGKESCICGLDLRASYTYIDSSDSSTTKDEGNVYPVNTHPGFVTNTFDAGKGTWHSEYQEWDLMLAFDNSCNRCYNLSHSFGIAGLNLDLEMKSKLDKVSPEYVEQTKFKSDLYGVGFRLGTAFKTEVCDCLDFFAGGHASVLIAESDSKTEFDGRSDVDTKADNELKEDGVCQLIPGYHLAAGFSYEATACNCDFGLRLGYEILVWHNLPNKRAYVRDSGFSTPYLAESSFSNVRTFGYHGLFAGIEVGF